MGNNERITPTISVIVPVYKVEAYLHRCIDSILAQTFTDFELILVDDGSPDRCGEICDEYAKKDARIRVVHQSNQGQAAARNNAIMQAQGEWICFVDSDDLIHPATLESLYRATLENCVDISMCGAIEAETMPNDFLLPRDASFTVHDVNEAYLFRLLQKKYRYWIVWGKLIKKEIIQHIPFTNGRIYEDNAIVCRWLYAAKRVADTDSAFYFYMVNPIGTTKSAFSIKKLDTLWALEENIRFYHALGYTHMLQHFLESYCVKASYYYWKVRRELRNNSAAKAIRKNLKQVLKDTRGIQLLPHAPKIDVYSVLSPIYARIYNLMHTLKNSGVRGLFQKIFRKIKKR